MYSKLTEMDKNKIVDYINAYSGTKMSSNLKDILRVWDESKNVYLSNIFKDKLILSKTITYEKPDPEIRAELSKDLTIRSLTDELYNFVNSDFWKSYDEKYYFLDLLRLNCLVHNRVPGYCPVLVLNLPNDKTFKIQPGMKILKFYEKLCEKYEIPRERFEAFRIAHSRILNTAKLKGELCLSIHPLDYMTMSDNEEGWDSCMSWENDGEYKQGTVEMMNSPCVVVGYLASEHNTLGWWGSNGEEWNSKKWRSLFIVDRDFIINVRSYPYDNNNLVKEAIKEIAKLAGWGDIEPQKYEYLEKWEEHRSKRVPVLINDRTIAIDFCTQAMYNDFGSNHFIALNPNDNKDIINFSYNYSGHSMCMWCGGIESEVSIGENEGERYLVCAECEGSFECSWCGERATIDDIHTTADGYHICSYCWENNTDKDIISDEIYMTDNMVEIYITRTNDDGEVDREHFSDCEMKYFYKSNVGTEDWHKKFKIDNPHHKIVYSSEYYDDERYYVFPQDLTEEGIRAFGFYDEDDLKDYVSESEDN